VHPPAFTRFIASEFLLYESFLAFSGSRYQVRERFPLFAVSRHVTHLRVSPVTTRTASRLLNSFRLRTSSPFVFAATQPWEYAPCLSGCSFRVKLSSAPR
jgi:hypothetical protein